jgi:hypothetical protein
MFTGTIYDRAMFPLDDARWLTMDGGYRLPYDPRQALERLDRGDQTAWDELWNELHHQGDVGVASYAAIPHILRIHVRRDVVDWQTYLMMGVVELCREENENPPIPPWLEAGYASAWKDALGVALRDLSRTDDETAVRVILGFIAMAKQSRLLGELLLTFDASELKEMVDAYQSGRSRVD